jgi:hypothetical protein
MRKRLFAAAVCAATVAGLSAGSAFAGEITGNGKWIAGSPDAPLNGKSECAYSGQNDDPNEAFPNGGRTQSWGQLTNQLGPMGGVPGTACNPARSGG